jgi:hypothetical protein
MRARAWVFAVAAIVTSIFFIDFCALVYQCGCRSLWAGADAQCNIHHAGVRHCPWCAIGLAGSVGIWAVIVAAQAGVAFWERNVPLIARAVLALATFPVVGGLLALATGVAMGYWNPE